MLMHHLCFRQVLNSNDLDECMASAYEMSSRVSDRVHTKIVSSILSLSEHYALFIH